MFVPLSFYDYIHNNTRRQQKEGIFQNFLDFFALTRYIEVKDLFHATVRFIYRKEGSYE